MELDVLTSLLLPISLALIMLGLGLGLSIDDFRRVVTAPKAVLTGLTAQFLLMPLIALGLIAAFRMDPILAAGMIVLALCPGGVTSNMFTFLARGDVALSISLTAVISVVAPFSVPLLAGWLIPVVSGADAPFTLSVLETFGTLVLLTLVPVAIGMAIRSRAVQFATRTERWVGPASVFLLFLIIAGIFAANREDVPGFLASVGPVTLVFNLLAFSGGWLLATILKLGAGRSATVGIEAGLQNGTMAILITGNLIGDATMTIVPAVYSLLMFPVGALFVVLVRRGMQREMAEG